MNLALNTFSSDMDLRIMLMGIAKEAERRGDGPLSAILHVAVRTLDQRIESQGEAPSSTSAISTQLICRNVRVLGRRTSIRMESDFWDALESLAERTGTTVSSLCSDVSTLYDGGNLTSAVRVYLLRQALREREGGAA